MDTLQELFFDSIEKTLKEMSKEEIAEMSWNCSEEERRIEEPLAA